MSWPVTKVEQAGRSTYLHSSVCDAVLPVLSCFFHLVQKPPDSTGPRTCLQELTKYRPIFIYAQGFFYLVYIEILLLRFYYTYAQ